MSKPARRIEIPDELAAALAPYFTDDVFDQAAFRRDCEDASQYLQQWDEAHPEELAWILNLGHPVEGEDNGA
ncbi:MAG: hypothetical protein ACR2KU_08915 [Gammaproteobacteria bacterium]